MKKIITFFVLLISFSINSQISSLAELASGDIQLFNPIYEMDKSIYGYFMVVKLDDVSKTEQKFEYVFLDKNLNKVANGEFIDASYKKYASEFMTPEKVGDKIILSKIYYRWQQQVFGNNSDYKFVSNRILDLTTNKISKPFYFENELVVEGERATEKIDKRIKKNIFIQYPLAIDGGYLLFKQSKLQKNSFRTKKIATLEAYNIDNSKNWQYNYNPEEHVVNTRIEFLNEEIIVLWAMSTKTKSQVLHFINPKTGKADFKYEIENKKSEFNHFYKVRKFKDRTVIVGMTSKNKLSGFNYKKATGFFKIVLDNNGNETFKKYFKWEDAGNILDIKKNGKLKEDGYRLLAKQFFIFEDGTTAFLTEKFKDTQYYVVVALAPKTTDFLVLNFDKEFALNNVEKIEKDKSYYSSSDYLYSQRIKDGNGVVFFYRDYKKDEETKKKNWVLGIVTIIDGKMQQEQIPMSSEEHFISPYIAKEGYILLREFNKDSDHDEIRLEKLNY
ncbi:hypothetical protein H9W90_02885 [Polaribacter pectinis]|uniref:Uncharacterized protein n=1 Tax=Polaribacter pectinis TaxID=2738844 RepID=A0A7G9LBS9_9FLAO|nr:DUF6770 family protein [Polaribacter pectinis]QNM86078.1 hypothetical protein H9W90_02885 [Polaribacter pectinis]